MNQTEQIAEAPENGVEEQDERLVCCECGKPIEDGDKVTGPDGEIRHQDCHYEIYSSCEHCGNDHAADEMIEVDGEWWCPRCVRRDAFRCDHCGDRFPDDQQNAVDGGDTHVCDSCSNQHYTYCEHCDTLHSNDYDCPLGQEWSSRCGYHDFTSFKIKRRGHAPALGLEMEVGDIRDLHDFGESYDCYLGESFAGPTEDGSLGDNGVEFVGHPWCVLTHLDNHDKYTRFFGLLDRDGGTTEDHASGCHTNIHFSAFNGREAINRAIILADRFVDAFMVFTHRRERSYRRSSYCKDIVPTESGDYVKAALRGGKYSMVNIKEDEELVEFRFPGMDLECERHLAQVQLIHNMVAYANTNAPLDGDYREVFFPVIFQSSVGDFIEVAKEK